MTHGSDREELEAQGFIARRGLLTPSEVSDWRRCVELAVRARTSGPGQRFVVGLSDDDEPAYLLVKALEELFPTLRSALNAASSFTREIVGPGGSFRGPSEVLVKPPRAGAGTHWHQDEATMDPGFLHEAVTVWIALDNVTRGTGALGFVPGSHRGPVLRHAVDPAGICDFDAASATYVELEAGDASVHHCRTVHGAGPNQSPETQRRGLILRYDFGKTAVAPEREPIRDLPLTRKRKVFMSGAELS